MTLTMMMHKLFTCVGKQRILLVLKRVNTDVANFIIGHFEINHPHRKWSKRLWMKTIEEDSGWVGVCAIVFSTVI